MFWEQWVHGLQRILYLEEWMRRTQTKTLFVLLGSLDLILLTKGLLRSDRDHSASGSRGQVGSEGISGRRLTFSLCSSCTDFGDALSLCGVTQDVPEGRGQLGCKPYNVLWTCSQWARPVLLEAVNLKQRFCVPNSHSHIICFYSYNVLSTLNCSCTCLTATLAIGIHG